ncbi:hypothetical protein [Nocardia aurantia]|nr:hypothetical protein [Nocardia aurantia]
MSTGVAGPAAHTGAIRAPARSAVSAAADSGQTRLTLSVRTG